MKFFNKTPSAIALSSIAIDENNENGSIIGILSSEDEDAGDTHTYTLVEGDGDTDNASFSIEGNALKAAQTFDFETKSSYSIRIKTTDCAGLSHESTNVITVNDVQEVITGITQEENPTLKMYPNPADRYLVVSFDKVMESVRLVNSTGSTVLTKQLDAKQVRLNVEGLIPGVYVAVVQSKKKVYTRRIVVVR
jgi:hypothetical protein